MRDKHPFSTDVDDTFDRGSADNWPSLERGSDELDRVNEIGEPEPLRL